MKVAFWLPAFPTLAFGSRRSWRANSMILQADYIKMNRVGPVKALGMSLSINSTSSFRPVGPESGCAARRGCRSPAQIAQVVVIIAADPQILAHQHFVRQPVEKTTISVAPKCFRKAQAACLAGILRLAVERESG